MVEGRIAGAQGDGGAEMLAQQVLEEEEEERLAKGFRISTCLNHCLNVQVGEVEVLTSVGPLVAAEVVVEVGAGLETLDRHTFQIPMAQM